MKLGRLVIIAVFLIGLLSPALALVGGSRIIVIGGGIKLLLSGTTVSSTATVGTTIGTLSVAHGVGTYTYTFVSNPGTLFSVSGSLLQVAASLTAGSDPITIKANNGKGSIVTASFVITVTNSGDILLVDGVSLLLQTDGASFVCLAAGC